MAIEPLRGPRAGNTPWAVVLVAAITCGIVAWIAFAARRPARIEIAAATVEAPSPSRRTPIPEARVSRVAEKTALERALELLARARALASGDAAMREEALMAYARAEDALRDVMDEARAKSDSIRLAAVEPVYAQCLEESDALVYALFDDARIERTPWRDLFAPPVPAMGHDGLARCERDETSIRAVGAPVGSKRQGILSVGDLERWRDFVLETEFELVRGEARMYWRLGKQASKAPDEVVISEKEGVRLGERYTLTATYLGSRRTFTWSANAAREADHLDPIGWRRERVGAFGVLLDEDAGIRITGLRIRVLRAGR